jgi:CO dehydrogenase maturation factor
MSTTVAISGKGGSGKTTVAAMIVRHLVERTGRSVLAVDADPNTCLGDALGVEPETTIGDICDRTLAGQLAAAPGMSRERAFEYAIHRAVVEAKGFDLLAMGHTEGPKCYCAVNHLLRKYLDEAGQDYAYAVLDNEAGMEHLSRQTTNAVDFLLIVTEATVVGAKTAQRILGLSNRLPITIGERLVLWNKVEEGGAAPAGGSDLPAAGSVPFDRAVLDLSTQGKSVFELPADSPALVAVGRTLTELLGTPAARAP